MGGFFGVAAKKDCVFDLFFGTDYHSHLGTRRGGMCVYDKEKGFDRAIHSIENSPFRTKFDKEVQQAKGNLGIGCISDYDPQPLIVRSHHGTYAITTVGKINNIHELTDKLFSGTHSHFLEMSGGYRSIPLRDSPTVVIGAACRKEDMRKFLPLMECFRDQFIRCDEFLNNTEKEE